MTKILDVLAISACKLLVKIGKLMGKKGSSAPGSVAMKISPSCKCCEVLYIFFPFRSSQSTE